MVNTLKEICRDLASQLAERGVRFAVLSPGSRNAPLIIALERHPQIRTKVVIDERSAAFMALGYAAVSESRLQLYVLQGLLCLTMLRRLLRRSTEKCRWLSYRRTVLWNGLTRMIRRL